MHQTLEMQQNTFATEDDGDGLVNYPMSVGTVEAVAFLKECAPGAYRVSLRSKGDINVARIAEMFGGGGHRNASGCTLKGNWAEVEQEVVELLSEAVAKRDELDTTDGNGYRPQSEAVI